MEEPEPGLVRAAAAGDLQAFTELVQTFQEPVWRYVRHLVIDPALAEDVAQEAFLKAFQALDGFAFRSRFSTWLFAIARNAAIDALRRRDRRTQAYRIAAPVATPSTPPPVLRTEVAAAVRSLSDKLRDTLLLVEVVGLTHREAAEVLDVPEGTVKSRMYLARRHLTEWFEQDDAQDDAAGEATGGEL